MNKYLLTACALLLGLTLTGSAKAHDSHHNAGHGHVIVGTSHHQEHGVRFSGGYYYRGFNNHHWASCVWDTRYGRYQYYDPYYRCYYYWDAGRDCYYPVCP